MDKDTEAEIDPTNYAQPGLRVYKVLGDWRLSYGNAIVVIHHWKFWEDAPSEKSVRSAMRRAMRIHNDDRSWQHDTDVARNHMEKVAQEELEWQKMGFQGMKYETEGDE